MIKVTFARKYDSRKSLYEGSAHYNVKSKGPFTLTFNTLEDLVKFNRNCYTLTIVDHNLTKAQIRDYNNKFLAVGTRQYGRQDYSPD